MERVRVSQGNKKVGKDTLILNMCSSTACPSKQAGLCNHPNKCYAMKAERCYPTVLPYRQAQENTWRTYEYRAIADDLVDIIKSKKGIKYLRFSEAGDFSEQYDVDKMYNIARIVKLDTGVHTYGYTARKDLEFRGEDYMTVNGSGFMLDNNFKAVDKYTGKGEVCKMNCRVCDYCKRAGGELIEVKYH